VLRLLLASSIKLVNDAVFEEKYRSGRGDEHTMRVRVRYKIILLAIFNGMDEGFGQSYSKQNSNQTKKAANRRPRLTFTGKLHFQTLH